MLRQALHIFRKDVYYLRHEITLVLLVALAFALMHTPAMHAQNNSWLAELALVATSVFLIGRLVLAEAIPGDQQFWITRPYRWQSLLGCQVPVYCDFREFAGLAGPFIHSRHRRLPSRSEPARPALGASSVVHFSVAALRRNRHIELRNGGFHFFPIDCPRGRRRHLGDAAAQRTVVGRSGVGAGIHCLSRPARGRPAGDLPAIQNPEHGHEPLGGNRRNRNRRCLVRRAPVAASAGSAVAPVERARCRFVYSGWAW